MYNVKMKGVLICLCAVLYLSSPTVATLIEFLHGSLSDYVWHFNITVYMRHFEGRIMLVTDYERNFLELKVSNGNDTGKKIEFTYNAIYQTNNLIEQCGCDPCDEKLMNLKVFGYKALGKVALWCNNHLFSIVTRNDITNRSNSYMPDQLQKLNEVKNVITIVLGRDKEGCLYRFNYNHRRITFSHSESKLLPSCPRNCPFGICNNGQCRMLDVHGPMCDCSSTALNGPYCNNSLRVYIREYNNTYDIDESIPSISFKLSWKRLYNKAYCLLQFVHTVGQETLWIYESHLLKGSEVLHDIEADGINFLSVKMKKYNLEIKVNHTTVFRKRVFMNKTRINIGFSNAGANCETFEGLLDLILSKTGFLPANDSSTKHQKTREPCFEPRRPETSSIATVIRRQSIQPTLKHRSSISSIRTKPRQETTPTALKHRSSISSIRTKPRQETTPTALGRSFLSNQQHAEVHRGMHESTVMNWKLICGCLATVSLLVIVSLSTAVIILRRRLLIANNRKPGDRSHGQFRMLNEQLEYPSHMSRLVDQDSIIQDSTI